MVNCKYFWQYFLFSADLTFSVRFPPTSVSDRHGQGHMTIRTPSSFKVKGKESAFNMTHHVILTQLPLTLATLYEVTLQALLRMSPSQHAACTGIHGKIIILQSCLSVGPWSLLVATKIQSFLFEVGPWFRYPQLLHLESCWTAWQWTSSFPMSNSKNCKWGSLKLGLHFHMLFFMLLWPAFGMKSQCGKEQHQLRLCGGARKPCDGEVMWQMLLYTAWQPACGCPIWKSS